MISRIIKASVSVISLGHKRHTLTLIILDIAIPQVRNQRQSWILNSRPWILDSSFVRGAWILDSNCSWDSGFQSPGIQIPQAKLPGLRNPDSLARGDNWDNDDVQGCSGC